MAVWQPEDVHLVRDILNLEHKPLNEVLKVEALKPEDEDGKTESDKKENPPVVNKTLTKMGRPVNTHAELRWKPIDETGKIIKNYAEIVEEARHSKKDEELFKFNLDKENIYEEQSKISENYWLLVFLSSFKFIYKFGKKLILISFNEKT